MVIRINTKVEREGVGFGVIGGIGGGIDSVLKNSAPCSQCVKFLQNNNIHKIIYSLDDGTLHFSRVKDLEDTHISRGQRAIIRKRKGILDS